MKILSLLIPVFGLFTWIDAFAVDPPLGCDLKDFSCYESTVKSICIEKNPAKPWTMNPEDLGSIRPECPYRAYTKEGIDEMVRCMEAHEGARTTGPKDGISLESIGIYSGFRGLEVARTLYRKKMNTVFSCGIISNRVSKLKSLEEALKSKGGPNTEIRNSVKRELTRYENLLNSMNCNKGDSGNTSVGTTDRMIRSAMKEYCSYTYYLDYLSRNTSENITESLRNDARSGNGNTPPPGPSTTDVIGREIGGRDVAIRDERARANSTLPKAIRVFREMDRTYIIHVMLTYIYSDYVTLRDSLSNYLAIVGQTFEKSYNAMDARQN